MAATTTVNISVCIDGLDSLPTDMKGNFTDTVAPELAPKITKLEQETADVAQVLDIVGIDTLRGVLIKAVSGIVSIDTSYSASFNEEIRIEEGQFAFFKPSGTIYFKNYTSAEKVTIGYLPFGTQS